MWFSKLLPREGNFFELFDQHAEFTAQGARAFMAMIQNYNDIPLREKYAAEVDVAERAADKITAEVHRLLHRTFITPIDGEQIRSLINSMDDIIDLLQDTSEVLSLYNVQRVGDDVMRLCEISVRCCDRVQHVVSLLPRLKAAFRWLGERLVPPQPAVQNEAECAWSRWLAQGGVGPQPVSPLDPATPTALEVFRRQMAEPRARAARKDPTTYRQFGRLPSSGI